MLLRMSVFELLNPRRNFLNIRLKVIYSIAWQNLNYFFFISLSCLLNHRLQNFALYICLDLFVTVAPTKSQILNSSRAFN